MKGGEGGSQTPPHAMCNYFFILDTFRVILTVLTYTSKQQLNIPGCHLVNIYHSVLINKINKDTIPHLLTKWWWSNGIDTRSNRNRYIYAKKVKKSRNRICRHTLTTHVQTRRREQDFIFYNVYYKGTRFMYKVDKNRKLLLSDDVTRFLKISCLSPKMFKFFVILSVGRF